MGKNVRANRVAIAQMRKDLLTTVLELSALEIAIVLNELEGRYARDPNLAAAVANHTAQIKRIRKR